MCSMVEVGSISTLMGSRPKREARCNKDRISALPDALLCHILAFLPTTWAVRTTALSRRWKNVWTSVPNLYFHAHHDFYDAEDFSSFTTFVDRVLFFRGSAHIKKFCLVLDEVDTDVVFRVDDWLCTAVWRNVVELDLSLRTSTQLVRASIESSLEFPQSLFTCKTLEILKVSSNCITYAPPTSGCFPYLKILHVTVHYPDDDDSTINLFSCCPVLESLTIDGFIDCFEDETHEFPISMPNLRSLRISLVVDLFSSNSGYKFVIDCPKLENLHIVMDEETNFSLGYAKSLVRADIDFKMYQGDEEEETDGQPSFATRATEHLALLLEVRYLSLHIHCFEASRLPTFWNLNQLKLDLHECNYWDVLLQLLIRSPHLEHLVLDASRKCWQPHGSIRKRNSEGYSELQWNPPDGVPVCMLLHLKIITIREFKGRRDEMEVVKYLLKEGQVLDKMTIYTRKTSAGVPYVEEKVLLKELLWFERGSKTCRVEIFN